MAVVFATPPRYNVRQLQLGFNEHQAASGEQFDVQLTEMLHLKGALP